MCARTREFNLRISFADCAKPKKWKKKLERNYTFDTNDDGSPCFWHNHTNIFMLTKNKQGKKKLSSSAIFLFFHSNTRRILTIFFVHTVYIFFHNAKSSSRKLFRREFHLLKFYTKFTIISFFPFNISFSTFDPTSVWLKSCA